MGACKCPAIRLSSAAACFERSDGQEPYWRAISDAKGRVQVAAFLNQDLGDAWEISNDPAYPGTVRVDGVSDGRELRCVLANALNSRSASLSRTQEFISMRANPLIGTMGTPKAFPGLMPKRAMPARFFSDPPGPQLLQNLRDPHAHSKMVVVKGIYCCWRLFQFGAITPWLRNSTSTAP